MVAGTKVGYLGPGRTGDLQEPNSMEAALGQGRYWAGSGLVAGECPQWTMPGPSTLCPFPT